MNFIGVKAIPSIMAKLQMAKGIILPFDKDFFPLWIPFGNVYLLTLTLFQIVQMAKMFSYLIAQRFKKIICICKYIFSANLSFAIIEK